MVGIIERGEQVQLDLEDKWIESVVDVLNHGGGPCPPRPNGSEQVPPVLTLVAGAHAAQVGRIFAGQRLGCYMTATDRQRHVWHCWLSAPAAAERAAGASMDETFRLLTGTRARSLLAGVYGCCPGGLVQSLGKCGAKAEEPAFYRSLVKALARDDLGAKFLRHSAALSNWLVLNIAALPSHLQSERLFDALRKGGLEEDQLANICWLLGRMEHVGLAAQVETVLKARKPLAAVFRAIGQLPFPSAPWPGTQRLRPVPDCHSLLSIGRRFKNCLNEADAAAEHAFQVLKGSRYYYLWDSQEPALIWVVNLVPVGWMVEEARGPDNKPVSSATWASIEAELASWEELAPLWFTDKGEVTGPGYFWHHFL